MRRIHRTLPWQTVLLFCLGAFVLLFRSDSVASPSSGDDRQAHPSCRHCGMDRHRFAHSRMLITYTDGQPSAVCSLHCAALDMVIRRGAPVRSLQVADYGNRELIDAETASWVLGGKLNGVMTHRAKWAFATPASAHEFVAQHGGSVTDLSGALKAAYQDMYEFVLLRSQRAKKP